MKKSLNDVSIIPLTCIKENRGALTVVENNDIPFSFRRVFSVKANEGDVRGNHAHKECKQFMVCLNGEIDILIDDGISQKNFLLDKPNSGVLVPDGIWSTQKYYKQDSVLLVLCDMDYDEDDYIREYDQYLEYIGK